MFDRRDFLKTCGASGAVALAGTSKLAFAAPEANSYDTLVVVYLRGGMDGLTLFSPGGSNANRGAYETARPSIKVPLSGTGAGLAVSGDQWRLHPRAAQLRDLYTGNKLAVVLGAGMPAPVTRSHFDAQVNMEVGLAGQGGGVGWLTRVLETANLPGTVQIPAVSAGSITATSLLGSTETITLGNGADFRIDSGSWAWNVEPDFRTTAPPGARGIFSMLPELWSEAGAFEDAGRQTLDALNVIKPIDFGAYAAANGAVYESGSSFAQQLKMLAQLIKRDVGLRVATIDLGGWDTHDGQGNPANSYDYFGNKVEELSKALSAFYTDLNGAGAANYAATTNIVVMSEFGRRVRENDDGGTDHGYGNIMLALGGAVNGGQTFGSFAGLATNQLFEGADVMVTTDYRRVLSEAVIRRLRNPNVYYAFPGYSGYTPLGIFQGTDLPPTGNDRIFANGFQ
ncbi:MAG: hypothetical protein AMXMBFR59_42220 [Rhodanobacteraceae bacterium]